jgi:hypothetical protein
MYCIIIDYYDPCATPQCGNYARFMLAKVHWMIRLSGSHTWYIKKVIRTIFRDITNASIITSRAVPRSSDKDASLLLGYNGTYIEDQERPISGP